MVALVWLEETKWLVFVETNSLEINVKNVSISKDCVHISHFVDNKCHVSFCLLFVTDRSARFRVNCAEIRMVK
jgi:hypothetical protein